MTRLRSGEGVSLMSPNPEGPGRAPRIAAPRPGRSAPGAGKIRSRRGDRVFSKGRCVYTFTNTAPTRQTPCPPPQPINPPIQLEGRGKAREMGDPVRTIQPTPKGRGKGRERRMDDENQMQILVVPPPNPNPSPERGGEEGEREAEIEGMEDGEIQGG
ncbi:hypothetical protein D5F01_LYC25261 [Larimichthys crocea]|uniref:Uncharacterized protein n=1 Tax=Larimichthys crocea TaxID=215358 RepID=A0A6G0HCU2_LARCR|nr:hypothetical protein D5F01_LYC25261 [Larimichthys crocea]